MPLRAFRVGGPKRPCLTLGLTPKRESKPLSLSRSLPLSLAPSLSPSPSLSLSLPLSPSLSLSLSLAQALSDAWAHAGCRPAAARGPRPAGKPAGAASRAPGSRPIAAPPCRPRSALPLGAVWGAQRYPDPSRVRWRRYISCVVPAGAAPSESAPAEAALPRQARTRRPRTRRRQGCRGSLAWLSRQGIQARGLSGPPGPVKLPASGAGRPRRRGSDSDAGGPYARAQAIHVGPDDHVGPESVRRSLASRPRARPRARPGGRQAISLAGGARPSRPGQRPA